MIRLRSGYCVFGKWTRIDVCFPQWLVYNIYWYNMEVEA